MIKLNIHEAKTHRSKYLSKLKPGERILLCKRNQPVAEITPLPEVPPRPRPIGLAKENFSFHAHYSSLFRKSCFARLKAPKGEVFSRYLHILADRRGRKRFFTDGEPDLREPCQRNFPQCRVGLGTVGQACSWELPLPSTLDRFVAEARA